MTKREVFKAINWNVIPDPLDKEVWDKLTANFWIDTRFPISNDLKSWHTFSDEWRWLILRNFAGLTLLDTLQSQVGAISMMPDATTPHEEAVLTNIAFMESVHAKSYSTIFQTLATGDEIDRVFKWSEENEYLQNKAHIIMDYYEGADPLKRKIASTLLESFLFFSGFYLPLWLNSQGKLTQTADIIKFIIRDEAIHGYYLGQKFQKGFEKLTPDEQEEMKDWTYEFLQELYDNEVRYTEDLYDEFDLTEDVKIYLRYNANKALQNLGFEALFEFEAINPVIRAGLSLETETHDFFSTTGSYTMGKTEATTDDDWGDDEFGDDF